MGLEETRPLTGQTLEPITNSALGSPDPLTTLTGSARIDYYADDGSVFTVDGGIAQATNGVVVTGLGRVQVKESLRPWARVAWAADRFNLMAYYSGRSTPDSQVTLGSGIQFRETSAIFHVEGQFNEGFANDKGRVVIGGSLRNSRVDTEGTLMPAQFDDRSDTFLLVAMDDPVGFGP